MDKAEKIKAARKKLKEFQSHKKDTTTASDQLQPEEHPVQQPQQQQLPDCNGQAKANYYDNSAHSNFIIPTYESAANVQSLYETPALNQELFQQQTLPIQQMEPSPAAIDGDSTLRELRDLVDSQNHQIARFRDHEKSHADAVKVLVSEKSNLNDLLQKSEHSVQQLKDENEELHNRLNVSRHRVKQLESQAQTQPPTHDVDPKKLQEMVNERVKQLQESHQQIEAEKSDLKLLLNQQRIEFENLQKNFDHVNTEYHLSTVKIAQLTESNGVEVAAIVQETPETLHHSQVAFSQEVAIKQQQINELNSIIDQLNNDRDASETQYQNYVSAMTTEMQELKQTSEKLIRENDKLARREQNLLKHVGDLERQMQQQMQKQKMYAEQNQEQATSNSHSSEEIDKLTSQIASLTGTNESLATQVSQLESEKREWSKKLSERSEEIQGLEFQLEKMRTITPNLTQLMVDFEDKSTAASRALSQNQSLKEQLDELQRAFVTISNDKMELTDKLQSEVHLCRELKNRFDAAETELTAIKEKWHFKEDEMIRLSKENTALEKKILQQNIEIDRLRHYESKDYHGTEGIGEKELENSKRLIETLTNKINILESVGHNHDDAEHHSSHRHSHSHEHQDHSHDHSHDSCHEGQSDHSKCDHDSKRHHLLEEIELLKMEKKELIKAINDFQMTKKSEKDQDDDAPTENGGEKIEEMSDEKLKQLTASKSVTASMATEEALEALQGRFRRTMLEVAELTEEKQRLEHVVTQLQFETETIGEYITLYQNQRRQLKQKEHERDIQLRNLAGDRELMQQKLYQLNGLIEKFVLQHATTSDHIAVISNETSKMIESSEPIIANPENIHTGVDLEKLKKETAGKILEILSDIKTTNTRSYDSNIGVEKSCACCYGELKTV